MTKDRNASARLHDLPDASLLLLAAGVGRRYGGTKQLEEVGPAGQTLLDYSIYDAWRAGISHVVFVIRPELEDVFRESVGRRISSRLHVSYVHQRLDDLRLTPGVKGLPDGLPPPAERTKPWGTGQAVLAAADALAGPFIVANADDFYGATSFASLAGFLRESAMVDTNRGDIRAPTSEEVGHPAIRAPTPEGVEHPMPTHAMVGYALRDTLSPSGSVSRGLCRCTSDGWLEEIVETVGIEPDGDGARCRGDDGVWRSLPGHQPVSMNLWAFDRRFLDDLRGGFRRFLNQHSASLDREYYLPVAVQEAMRAGRARVRVLPSRDRWCGLTHRQDKDGLVEAIRERVTAGQYPEILWPK